ncbi:unnamed protein product [Moneuplotes crassus]|uniref:Uncharacterized protein n=1 Tax=Euplotes crassus TaxID=5936 RepID=A0AAD1U0J5_EUPCR|nr:unnamed protein product [Moneuplotes crassus]
MASKLDRKQTLNSTISQSQTTARNILTGIGKEAKNKKITSTVKNPKDLKRVNTKSPRFNKARERLEISLDEIRIRSKKEFDYNSKGVQEDPEVAKVRYQNYLRALMQTYNLILELRAKQIKKEIRVREFYGEDSEKASIDYSSMKNLNLTAETPNSLEKVWPSLLGKSRAQNMSLEKALPSSTNLTSIQRSYKLERQKIIMKNVLRNKLEEDRKLFELKEKLKEKEKKFKENVKNSKYDQMISKTKADAKKIQRLECVKKKMDEKRKSEKLRQRNFNIKTKHATEYLNRTREEESKKMQEKIAKSLERSKQRRLKEQKDLIEEEENRLRKLEYFERDLETRVQTVLNKRKKEDHLLKVREKVNEFKEKQQLEDSNKILKLFKSKKKRDMAIKSLQGLSYQERFRSASAHKEQKFVNEDLETKSNNDKQKKAFTYKDYLRKMKEAEKRKQKHDEEKQKHLKLMNEKFAKVDRSKKLEKIRKEEIMEQYLKKHHQVQQQKMIEKIIQIKNQKMQKDLEKEKIILEKNYKFTVKKKKKSVS